MVSGGRYSGIKIAEKYERMLSSASKELGVSEGEILESLIESLQASLQFIKGGLRGKRVSGRDLTNSIVKLLNYGIIMNSFMEYFLKEVRGERLGFVLEDAGWLKDFKGIYFYLVKTEGGTPWTDSLLVQLQSDNSAYLRAESVLGYRDELKEVFDSIVGRVEKALNEYLESNEYSMMADGWSECPDYIEVEFNVKSDGEKASIVGEVFVTGWECIPPLDEIEQVFEKVYKTADLEVKDGRIGE